ncbi:MAG: MFS transporter [Balneolaceae bacterium]
MPQDREIGDELQFQLCTPAAFIPRRKSVSLAMVSNPTPIDSNSIPRARASRRELFGWAMFDFANQGYTLLIITVIFPVLFTTVIVESDDPQFRLGNLLWSVAISLSYIAVVLSGPILGAMMDYSARKKEFLFYSYLVTILATAGLYWVDPGMVLLAMGLLIISNIAYSMGENFIASFLPSLGPPDELGKISGYGWALGYAGGLVTAGFVIFFLGEPTLENYDRIRWTGPFTAFFFLLTAIPTFLWLREPGIARSLPSGETFVSVGFSRLGRTFREIGEFRDLVLFLASVFFSMGGIYIIVAFSFIYGDQVIGWSEEVRVSMFLIVQITAAAGALLFGRLQDRMGARGTYLITLGTWFLAVMGIFFLDGLTHEVNRWVGQDLEPQHLFLGIGLLAGTSLGANQSVSRAIVGLLTPESRSAEMFGFWGMFNKMAGVFGIVGLGLLQTQVGLRNAILFCAILFLAAALIALFVDLSRGRKVARAMEERGFSD